jgi:hypothetical protein
VVNAGIDAYNLLREEDVMSKGTSMKKEKKKPKKSK